MGFFLRQFSGSNTLRKYKLLEEMLMKSNLGKSKADKLLRYILDSGYQLVTDQYEKAHIVDSKCSFIGKSVDSAKIRNLLSSMYWGKYHESIHPSAIDAVVETLKGIAVNEGEKLDFYDRIARVENTIYYDIGDDKNIIKIDASGWQITHDSPVIFRRYSSQQAQVLPEIKGDASALKNYFNLNGESQEILLQTYLPVCYISDIQRPLLLIHGPQGAGKSTLLQFIRSLVDPSTIPLLSPPRTTEELIRQANHNYCYFLDNLSYISQEMSDTLCRLVTGTSFAKRELYTDDEDIFYSFRRVVGFNGVAQFANQPDLLDRSLIISLERIKSESRQIEGDLLTHFELEKSKILGGIFDVLSKMMASIDSVTVSERLPRMADYYKYAIAAADSMGYGADKYKEAFRGNVQKQHDEALNASSVATLIVEFMNDQENWKGSGLELYQNLKSMAEERLLDRDFPKSHSWLWRKISESKTTLEASGVDASKDDSERPRVIILQRNSSFILASQQFKARVKPNAFNTLATSTSIDSNANTSEQEGLVPAIEDGHISMVTRLKAEALKASRQARAV
jgi:energy-coupling factor transporter ATP-binding protein EcfA2